MADPTSSAPAADQSGSHLLRWLILAVLALGAAAAVRGWALSKADAEFEERLRLADERRN